MQAAGKKRYKSGRQRGQLLNFGAIEEALWCAIDWMEIIGLTPEALGKHEPSMTYRLRASQVWPSGSVAEVLGEPPIRALPMIWNEKSASCAASQPAESMS